jgi:hypothetical protein
VRQEPVELVGLGAQLGVPRLRLLLHALEAPLHVVAVRDEELERQRLEVRGRIARAAERVEHHQERVDLTEVPEELGTRAGNVHDAHGRRGDLLRVDDLREPEEAAVGHRGHADVLLAELTGAGLRERAEQRRLPRRRQPDDAHLQRHGDRG